MKKVYALILFLGAFLILPMFIVGWAEKSDIKPGMPIGTIFMYSSNVTPENSIMCYGQSVSRTDYNALFAVTGTTYGTGSGATQFSVPDLRGIFVKGAGKTTRVAGVDASGTAYSTANGTYSQDHIQTHGHTLNYFITGTGGITTVSGEQVAGNYISMDIAGIKAVGPGGDTRTAYLTEPQYIGLYYAIKAK